MNIECTVSGLYVGKINLVHKINTTLSSWENVYRQGEEVRNIKWGDIQAAVTGVSAQGYCSVLPVSAPICAPVIPAGSRCTPESWGRPHKCEHESFKCCMYDCLKRICEVNKRRFPSIFKTGQVSLSTVIHYGGNLAWFWQPNTSCHWYFPWPSVCASTTALQTHKYTHILRLTASKINTLITQIGFNDQTNRLFFPWPIEPAWPSHLSHQNERHATVLGYKGLEWPVVK